MLKAKYIGQTNKFKYSYIYTLKENTSMLKEWSIYVEDKTNKDLWEVYTSIESFFKHWLVLDVIEE